MGVGVVGVVGGGGAVVSAVASKREGTWDLSVCVHVCTLSVWVLTGYSGFLQKHANVNWSL